MKIYVAGHRGLVGSAIVRNIELHGQHTWVGKSRDELDLLDRKAVFEYVSSTQPDAIVIAAAKVGGIQSNAKHPVEFLSQNLQIEVNLLDAAHEAKIPRLLFLGSSCVYPKLAEQPIKEEYLLGGKLEETNEAYALAKISGLKLVQAYRKEFGHRWVSAMPTNLYGPEDNFDLQNSHVLPALIRKFHEGKITKADSVEIWGSGTPLREFLHSDDLASACLFLLEKYDDSIPINVGTGHETSIKGLAETVQKIVGFEGQIKWDASKPDGTPRKLLDITRITDLGWQAQKELGQGIAETYQHYLLMQESGQVRK